MFTATTQETSFNLNDDLLRKLSLESDDFLRFLEEEYGACWGTLKFEDSLIDSPDQVNWNLKNLSLIEFDYLYRFDHFFTLIKISISIFSVNFY